MNSNSYSSAEDTFPSFYNKEKKCTDDQIKGQSQNMLLIASKDAYLSPQFYTHRMDDAKRRISDQNISNLSPLIKNRKLSNIRLIQPTSSEFKAGFVSSHSLFMQSENEDQKIKKKLSPINHSSGTLSYLNDQRLKLQIDEQVINKRKMKEENLRQINKGNKSVKNIQKKLSQLEDKPSFFNELDKYSRKQTNNTCKFESKQLLSSDQSSNLLSDITSITLFEDHIQKDPQNVIKSVNNRRISIPSKIMSPNSQQLKTLPFLSPCNVPRKYSSNNKLFSDFSNSPSSFKNEKINISRLSQIANAKNICIISNSSQNNLVNTKNIQTTRKSNSFPIKNSIFTIKSEAGAGEQSNTSPNKLYSKPSSNEFGSNSPFSNSQDEDQRSIATSDEKLNSNNELLVEKQKTKNQLSPFGLFVSDRLNKVTNYQVKRWTSTFMENEFEINRDTMRIDSPNLEKKIASAKEINIEEEERRNTLMRELKYLSNELKRYVCDQASQDLTLKQNIISFLGIEDMQEFEFKLGLFLDIVTEEQIQGQIHSPFKLSKQILKQITIFMSEYFQIFQKSQAVTDLFNEELSKHISLITPNTLLEELGDYHMISKISSQLIKLLLNSSLQNFIGESNEIVASEKLQEFLQIVLHNDVPKAKLIIETFKKVLGVVITPAEFSILKQVIFSYFQNQPYYVKDVRDKFFELIEFYRYYLISEDGFSQNVLDEKYPEIFKQMTIFWKHDVILSQLQEKFKGSTPFFLKVLIKFTFSQNNCIQLRDAFQNAFLAPLDNFIVQIINKLVKDVTKLVQITQHVIQRNISYAFQKLLWLVFPQTNFIKIMSDYNEIGQSMRQIIIQQKQPVSLSLQVSNINPEISSSPLGLNRSKFQRIIECNSKINDTFSDDVPNFIQFIALYFNFNTTYHYSDLVSFHASLKGSSIIFSYWAGIIAESLVEAKKASISQADSIRSYISNIFNLQNNS